MTSLPVPESIPVDRGLAVAGRLKPMALMA